MTPYQRKVVGIVTGNVKRGSIDTNAALARFRSLDVPVTPQVARRLQNAFWSSPRGAHFIQAHIWSLMRIRTRSWSILDAARKTGSKRKLASLAREAKDVETLLIRLEKLERDLKQETIEEKIERGPGYTYVEIAPDRSAKISRIQSRGVSTISHLSAPQRYRGPLKRLSKKSERFFKATTYGIPPGQVRKGLKTLSQTFRELAGGKIAASEAVRGLQDKGFEMTPWLEDAIRKCDAARLSKATGKPTQPQKTTW